MSDKIHTKPDFGWCPDSKYFFEPNNGKWEHGIQEHCLSDLWYTVIIGVMCMQEHLFVMFVK